MRPTLRARRARLDPAVHGAREVVGMYGDPDTTWGICVEAGLTAPLDVDAVVDGVTALCRRYPHLGAAPLVMQPADGEWTRARQSVAAAPYGPESPLLRVAVSHDRSGLLVGAHHGVIDGLGLLAVVSAATGRELHTLARGIGDRRAPHSFVASSVRRLGEALTHPPARFGGTGEATSHGEDLSAVTRPRINRGTANLALAVLQAQTMDPEIRSSRHSLLAIGASRRVEAVPEPDRQTAYLRLRMRPGLQLADVASQLADLSPEPDFPETSAGGAAPLAIRLLRNRLGATATLSNLGQVDCEGIVSLAMYPASSGVRSVAVGLASTASTTTLSLRTRRRDFTQSEHEALAGVLAERFFGPSTAQ